MKKGLVIGATVLGIAIVLSLMGWMIYWCATHTCIEWEAYPTGSKCVKYESYVSVCTSIDSAGNLRSGPCTNRRCVKRIPCLVCIRYVHTDDAPAELEKPIDRC